MKLPNKLLLGFGAVTLGLLLTFGGAYASTVAREWYFGTWDCNIDGRPAKMQWRVVNDPQTTCNGNVCSSTSGVKIVGHFSDNGGPWVPLAKRGSSPTSLSIRYLGAEQDNWYLRYNASARSAQGWTTWRGNRYSLSCSNRR